MTRRIMIGVIIIIALIVVLIGTMLWSYTPRQYSTTDVSEYGQYVGNYDNKSVSSFIESFFPDKIESAFTNIKYSYRAQKGDTYAFEAYLEFVIDDTNDYEAYVADMTKGLPKTEFRYDSDYSEYLISDEFDLLHFEENNKTENNIGYAKIGKILCSEDEHRIIFVAIGVYDGGLATADFLTVYFDRFNVDPLEYAANLKVKKD